MCPPHGFINVNYHGKIIVKLLLVCFPWATHSLSFCLLLSLLCISLEDWIITNSFGKALHGEHVKHWGCRAASSRPLWVWVRGICAECRCRLSTVTRSAELQFCFHILRILNEWGRKLLFTPALRICPFVGNKGTPFPYHVAGLSSVFFTSWHRHNHQPSSAECPLPSLTWKTSWCCQWIMESD